MPWIKKGLIFTPAGQWDWMVSHASSYRIGSAESPDGRLWTRRDERAGIVRSPQGWDSEMLAYPYVYSIRGTKYMLYAGNGFGKSGFGYAVLDEAIAAADSRE